MTHALPLVFKGERNYLQGGDFYNALADIARTMGSGQPAFVERLAFRRFAQRSCELHTEEPQDAAATIGQVRFRLNADQTLQGWLVQTDAPVQGRRTFDEARLLADATVDVASRSAHLPARSIYTPIEDVIALTKRLNYAMCPEVDGKWVFGQLDLLEALPDDYGQLDIRMKSLMAGRFSVNDILIDQRPIGTMRFITGVPS